MRRMKRRLLYAVVGTGLGLGAPVGWLLFRLLGDNNAWVVAELARSSALYFYMAIGTTVAFALSGFLLGRHDDALERKSEETRRALETATSLALTDGLTGVSNARHLHEQLSQEVDLSKRYRTALSCLLLDIDDFKRINDRFGHPYGDSVLIEVARMIRKCVRQVDISGRLGGEEFIVVMRHTTAAAAYAVAERVRNAVQRFAFFHEGKNLTVTVSIGVAAFPAPGVTDKPSLLKAADEALYTAKRRGKNRTCVHGDGADAEEAAGAAAPLRAK